MEPEHTVPPYPPERVEFTSPTELPGVGVLSVDDCARRWAVIHTTYTVCTGLAIGRPAEWRYRGRTYSQPADGVQLMEPGEGRGRSYGPIADPEDTEPGRSSSPGGARPT
jgi:hypothetical protein